MKAISLDAPKVFRMVDIAEPEKAGLGEAIVRVHRVGICGTDYGGYLGKMPFFSYPRIPGHELGVEVVEVGSDVQNVKVGDHCSVEPYINCRECYSCRRGLTNCCEHHKTLGVMCDGGMTSLFKLPARKLHPSKILSFEQLALVETLAIGCHAINRSGSKSGENVLVIGAGPIGLSAVEFAKLSGARTIVMDISSDRLAFVRNSMGIADTVQLDPSNPDAALQEVARITNKQFADVVVDATGNHQSMVKAMEYCAFGGRLVFVGITQAEMQMPHAAVLHRRELTILASRNALAQDFRDIIEHIEQKRIDTNPWITHHASFDSMIEVFPSWLDPASRVIKAMVAI